MRISVIGRRLEIGDELKTYIAKKLEGFSKYSSKIIEAKVIIEENRGISNAEIVIVADHTKYFGESNDGDIRGAVDKAIKKMDTQLRNHKEKMQHRHKKGRSISAPIEEMAEEIDEIIDEDYLE